MKRKPRVAGTFYPASSIKLKEMISAMAKEPKKKIKAIACVVPHAGYMYSGYVAGEVYSSIMIPNTAIVIGPNHTGFGTPASLMKKGEWETPLGVVSIETELAELLMKNTELIVAEENAHTAEHSVEVHLPFLQYFNSSIRFVPLCLMLSDFDDLLEIGEACASAIKNYHKPVLIVASTDLTHYESQSSAEKKDKIAINDILNLNADALYRDVGKHDISMCGYGPVISALTAAKKLGAEKTELIKYQTSGDITKDYGQVVGYGGMIIF